MKSSDKLPGVREFLAPIPRAGKIVSGVCFGLLLAMFVGALIGSVLGVHIEATLGLVLTAGFVILVLGIVGHVPIWRYTK